MFASDTLYELRVSLQLAEIEREGVINKEKHIKFYFLIMFSKGFRSSYFSICRTTRYRWTFTTYWL